MSCHSPSDYADKWYFDLNGLEYLHKYPQDFIDWINEPDTWAESIVKKEYITNIVKLFELWVTDTY